MNPDQARVAIWQALKAVGINSPSDIIDQHPKIIITSDNEINNFIGDENSSNDLEPTLELTQAQKYHAHARNLLRHLLYGTSLRFHPKHYLYQSPFFTKEVITTLLYKKDFLLLKAIREELQITLNNIYAHLNNKPRPEQEVRYSILLNIILALYPYLEPEQLEKIYYPVKINHDWHLVEYITHKINLSPRTGLLATLLDEKDYLYAYGLVPIITNPTINPLLLFMGTTFPQGQGADLAYLYNFYPNHSIGEGHNFTDIEKWLSAHPHTRVIGHSMGATVAMLVAAKFKAYISQADCFNPAPLASTTLKRLKPDWNNTSNKPIINVYAQLGDPILYLGKGLLDDTNLIYLIPGSHPCRENFYTLHVHYFLGRKNVIAFRGNLVQFNHSQTRLLIDNIKNLISYIKFPLHYIRFVIKLYLYKLKNSFKKLILVYTLFDLIQHVALLNLYVIETILLLLIGIFIIFGTILYLLIRRVLK